MRFVGRILPFLYINQDLSQNANNQSVTMKLAVLAALVSTAAAFAPSAQKVRRMMTMMMMSSDARIVDATTKKKKEYRPFG